MARPLLLLAALAAAALALHIPSRDDGDDGVPVILTALSQRVRPAHREESQPAAIQELQAAETEMHELEAVPPIDEFRDLWSRRYDTEDLLDQPMPDSIQLVLGVFTVAPDVEYRAVVRETWLQQKGVCYWQLDPKEGCSVYVAFVLGKSGLGLSRRTGFSRHMSKKELKETHNEEGVFVLDTTENMDNDKSQVWFDTARRLFPWASHVGKTDMDTYPFLHKLVHRMESGRGCSLLQSRYEVIGRPHDSHGPAFGSVCGGDACPQFVSAVDFNPPVALPGKPWSFVSGEFYALSMPLVQQVNWTGKTWGSEDFQVATRVGSAAQSKGFCVVLRRLDAWYHRSRECNASYANDLGR